jgi:hypothetical protein
MGTPPNKAMKLTSPEPIEVSQLIAGVVRTVGRATMTTQTLRRIVAVAACFWATGSVLYSADSDVATRERVIAASLRKVVPSECPSSAMPCCLAIPEGWVSNDFMTRLRGLALRMDGVDPLVGECAGKPVSVQSLEWTGAVGARVDIVFGTGGMREACTVFLSRGSRTWTVVKSVCERYSIL